MLCLTLAALALNNVTFASSDYLMVVLVAVGCAIAALVPIAATWKRQTWWVRMISVKAVLANAWTLVDALGRRLPALLQSTEPEHFFPATQRFAGGGGRMAASPGEALRSGKKVLWLGT